MTSRLRYLLAETDWIQGSRILAARFAAASKDASPQTGSTLAGLGPVGGPPAAPGPLASLGAGRRAA